MFEAWGRGLYRARRLTLVLAVLFAVAAGVWGTGVFSKLTSGNTFTPPSSESNRESALATSVFGRNEADVVVLYHSAAMTVTDPAYRQAVTAELGTLRPRTCCTPPRTGRAGRPASSPPTGTPLTPCCSSRARTMPPQAPTRPSRMTWPAVRGGITAKVGGTVPTEVAVNSAVTGSIARAEVISMPVLLLHPCPC